MVGGFEMNRAIRLPDALADQIGQGTIKPDFSWPNEPWSNMTASRSTTLSPHVPVTSVSDAHTGRSEWTA